MNHLPPLLNALDKLIRSSGKNIIRDFTEIERLQSSVKNPSYFINKSLGNLSKAIIENLPKIKPDLKVFKIDDESSEDCWIVSSLDSVLNYSRGISEFMLMIAHKEKQKVVNSILYNPLNDDTYYVSDGKGGFKNDFRLRVSEKKKISDSLISLNFNYEPTKNPKELNILSNLIMNSGINYRINNSIFYELSLLAGGKIDGFILVDVNKNITDIFKFIIKESGGLISNASYQNREILIISNKYVGKLIQEMIENKNENNK